MKSLLTIALLLSASTPVFAADIAEANCFGFDQFTVRNPMTVVLKGQGAGVYQGSLSMTEVASVDILLGQTGQGKLFRLTLRADEQETISAETFGNNVGISRGQIEVYCKLNLGKRISDI